MTATTHKQSHEIKLKKHTEKYRKHLLTEIKYAPLLTLSQKNELSDIIFTHEVGYRSERVALEKLIKKLKHEFVETNKKSGIKTKSMISISIQSKIGVF